MPQLEPIHLFNEWLYTGIAFCLLYAILTRYVLPAYVRLYLSRNTLSE